MKSETTIQAGERTHKNTYKGYRIYFPSTGSGNRLRSIKAKHPMSVARLEITLPDNGMSKPDAIRLMKREIDRITTP